MGGMQAETADPKEDQCSLREAGCHRRRLPIANCRFLSGVAMNMLARLTKLAVYRHRG